MTIKPITDAQKAVLNAASGGGKSRASRYAEPTVQPVDRFGVLHPDTTGVDNVEIVVDYDGMPNNDILFFYWNGDLSIPSAVADTKPKRVAVPAALVIAAANKTINVIYSVIDDNNPDGVPSDVHTQVIEKYTPPVYPPPVITEAVGGVLDVGALTKNATVTVAAWPGIAVGQKIWLSMVSTPPVKLTKWVGFPITNTGAQSTTISLDKLKTLLDGSTIELHFEVSFDGGLTRVPFPTTTYTIKQVQVEVRPVIKSVTGPSGPVDNGGSTTDTEVILRGTAAANREVEILDGAVLVNKQNVDNAGGWTLQVNPLSPGSHSFTARGLYGNNPESEVWDLTIQSSSGVEDFEAEWGQGIIDPYICRSRLVIRSEAPGISMARTHTTDPDGGRIVLAIGGAGLGGRYGELILPGASRQVDSFWYAGNRYIATDKVEFIYFNQVGVVIGSKIYSINGFQPVQTTFIAPLGEFVKVVMIKELATSGMQVLLYKFTWQA